MSLLSYSRERALQRLTNLQTYPGPALPSTKQPCVQLTIRLRARVTDLALDVADVVELGQVADHLQDNDVLVEVLLAGGGELEARRSSLELAAVRNPGHLRALVEDVSGVKELVIYVWSNSIYLTV